MTTSLLVIKAPRHENLLIPPILAVCAGNGPCFHFHAVILCPGGPGYISCPKLLTMA